MHRNGDILLAIGVCTLPFQNLTQQQAIRASKKGKLFKMLSKMWLKLSENLLLPYANNKGADQPAHPRSRISTFFVRCLDSIIHTLAKFIISRLWLDSEAEQTGLSLTWSETTDHRFSRDEVQY